MQWIFAQVIPFPPNSPFSRTEALVCFLTSSFADFFLPSIVLPCLCLWLFYVPLSKQGRGVLMNVSGRAAVADPDLWAFCSSPPSLSSRIARQKLSSCISIDCACQKIILSSQILLERLSGITRVHCRYHCACPCRNTIHVSRWSTVLLNQDCSVTFPDESAASWSEGYSLPCLWLVLLSWPAWPAGRAGMCPRSSLSLCNVAALRSLCLQGSFLVIANPCSSISGNWVHWGISWSQLLLLERKSLGLSRDEILLCAEVSEHSRGCSFLEGISHWFILGIQS